MEIKIQSISDVITNSSSEVFICSADKDQDDLRLEIEELINSLMTTLGYENDPYYDGADVEVADSDGEVEGWGIKYNKGDILIWSRGENSIPYNILSILEDIEYLPKFSNRINDSRRHHLG